MTSAKDVKMALNGPVVFLVQEQAKSVAAIQALQSRMAVLETLQERLILAIDEVNQHLASSSDASKDLHAKNLLRPTAKKKPKTAAKSDSLNKDSGIGASDSSLPPTEEVIESDELLQLLELLDERSLALLNQGEGSGMSAEGGGNKPVSDASVSSNSQLLDDLLFEKVDSQRQLSEVKAERDELRKRLARLELATETVQKQKLKVQRVLDSTLQENQSLQNRIGKSKDGGVSRSESLGYLADIAKSNIRKKYREYSEKSRPKVSTILKECNVLELQKHVLTYVMENDILRAKLQQDEPSKVESWLAIESRLKINLKEALDQNRVLQETLQSKELEIATLKDKVRQLEEGSSDMDSCVKNFGMGSTEDWRAPGMPNIYDKHSNLAAGTPLSPLEYGDFSKTQSLPVTLMAEQRIKLEDQERYHPHAHNSDSFTDVPLDHSSHFEQNSPSKDLVDLNSPMEHNYSSTSTLVQSPSGYQPNRGHPVRLSVPNLSATSRESLQNWCFAVPRKEPTAKLVNGHLCWKARSVTDDISSICTEFDPLSDETTPSGEHFVDSLNLTAPLKPTQVPMSQLSSMGDSLHSTSLELGCNAPPPLLRRHEVPVAKSVDGIRELLLLENAGFKQSGSVSHYSHSSVVRPYPVMNCVRVSSDYPLL